MLAETPGAVLDVGGDVWGIGSYAFTESCAFTLGVENFECRRRRRILESCDVHLVCVQPSSRLSATQPCSQSRRTRRIYNGRTRRIYNGRTRQILTLIPKASRVKFVTL